MGVPRNLAAAKDIVVPAQNTSHLSSIPEMPGSPRVKEEASDPIAQPASTKPIQVKQEPRTSGFRPASQLLAIQASPPSSPEAEPSFGMVKATRQGRTVKMPKRFRDI